MSRAEKTFSQLDMDRFGIASGSTGLIHTEPEFAATTPFGATLVQGIYLLAMVERELCLRAPRWAECGTLDVRFMSPVTAGTPFQVELTYNENDTWSVQGLTPSEPAVIGTARVGGHCSPPVS